MKTLDGQPFFCSFSGGKDSTLALHHALEAGGAPTALFTMLTEDGVRSRSHALPPDVLHAQAEALGIALRTANASWPDYEAVFIEALRDIREHGVTAGVFGDIDVDRNRQWVERVCAAADVEPFEPLWQRARRELLDEFLALGFKATIIAIKSDLLDKKFLGRTLDAGVVAQLEQAGIDPSGEMGEYHTVVTDGPIFSQPVGLEKRGTVEGGGYTFLEVAPAQAPGDSPS